MLRATSALHLLAAPLLHCPGPNRVPQVCLDGSALPGTTHLCESKTGPYEVLSCEPLGPARRTVVIIPGNPGLPDYYAGFAAELCTRLQAKVKVVGLAGHVSTAAATSGFEGLPVPIRGAETLPSDLSSETVANMFDSFDTDGSGSISLDELGDAIERLGLRVSSRQRRAMLRKFDVDASGEIERDEFEAIVKEAQAAVGARGFLSMRGLSFGSVVAARYRALHALDDQVDHLQEVVGEVLREEQQMPITLIGHSIGAWLASRTLERLKAQQALEATPPLTLFLMPFLEQNMGDATYRLKHMLLMRCPFLIPLIAMAAPLLRWAPSWLRRRLLAGTFDEMDPSYARLTERSLLHYSAIYNFLHLARTEMVSHQSTFDMQPLRALADADSLCALFVDEGDEWAPLTMQTRLAAAGVPTTVVEHAQLGHAFSCTAPQTQLVAGWVCEQIHAREEAGRAGRDPETTSA